MSAAKIGIIGAGNIAAKMAETLQKMDDAECYAVASRSIDKAMDFAEKNGVTKAFGSYEEMLADKNIDLVYVATPHSHHCEHALLALEYGHNVLCEKAFAENAEQAKTMIRTAEKKNLFISEAIWTRYLPMRKIINDLVYSGKIGKPVMLTANLGYEIADVPRLREPSLAGGTLLDLGVYTLNFAGMVFGSDFCGTDSTCTKIETGVDGQNTITLTYPDGKIASLMSTMFALTDRRGIIYGTDGYVLVENINNPESAEVIKNGTTTEKINAPAQITGFEYQVRSCINAIKSGKTECPEMPHSEIIKMMETMDAVRSAWK